MSDPGDTVILHNELAFVDWLPVQFDELVTPADAGLKNSWSERNVRLLLASAAIEEHGKIEKADDSGANSADLARIEHKLGLLLDVVGYLLATTQSRPTPSAIRFNAIGAIWEAGSSAPRKGAAGLLQVYLRDVLVQPLCLHGRVESVNAGQTHVVFDAISESVAEQMEKYVFRHHRRQVAGARGGRRG